MHFHIFMARFNKSLNVNEVPFPFITPAREDIAARHPFSGLGRSRHFKLLFEISRRRSDVINARMRFWAGLSSLHQRERKFVWGGIRGPSVGSHVQLLSCHSGRVMYAGIMRSALGFALCVTLAKHEIWIAGNLWS